MLLHVKIILISVVYISGAMFMILYPARNFNLSGGKIRILRTPSSEFEHSQYLSYEEIFKIASKIANNAQDFVRLVKLEPSTLNNRTIVALELQSDKKSNKPGILVIGAPATMLRSQGTQEEDQCLPLLADGVCEAIPNEWPVLLRGLDPMVWSAPNAIIELAYRLLYDASFQTPFFNDYDWYLIPLSNPDGLEFTYNIRAQRSVNETMWSRNVTSRKSSRPSEWHKNMQNEYNITCFGININRNFPHHWQDDHNKAPDVCSQYYPGSEPSSSSEAKAIKTYVDKLGDAIQVAIELHASFVPKKEFILYPWRFSQRQHSNAETLQSIGEYAARQSRLPDGRLYEVHQSSLDGQVAGSLSDYLTGVVGIDLVYHVKPYHQLFPNFTDYKPREMYIRKTWSVILSLVRGWRSNDKANTLTFFGRDIDF